MDDLLSEFLTETSESLESLDVELVRLEQNPNDPEILGNIFRLVHTIKGTCGFLGLPRLESVAHAGENVLGNFREGVQTVSPQAVSLILEALDRIKWLLSVLEETEAEPDGEDSELIARLDAMYRSAKAGNVVEAPVAPAEPAAPTTQPGATDPGATDPGATDPGATDNDFYARIGGLSTIDTAVELLYRKINADEGMAGLFEPLDLIRLQGDQVAFLTKALGGPDEYTGEHMTTAFAQLKQAGFSGAQFDATLGFLGDSLNTLEVDADITLAVLQIVEGTRPDMVGGHAEPAQIVPEAAAPQATVPEPVPEPELAPAEAAGAPAATEIAPLDTSTAESVANVQQPEGGAPTKDSAVASQSIRVNVDMLEDLMTMVSELVLTRNQLMQMVRKFEDSEFKVPLQRLSLVTTDLQEGVMKTRMQPIGNAWSKLPRIVRDLSLELGKKIDLEMIGADTELDRQVLELIKDPLTHMVRNSGDHGVETPDQRVAAGKVETGKIQLKAYHEGGHIIIEIGDDGRGLALSKIKERVIANGLATGAELEAMPEKQIQQFIFKAGFSTAEKVTNVSGRGVGMDVVRTNIEKIGGQIELRSVEGQGSSFTIKIPLTLAIVSALIVECCGERFAIPQLSVVELVRISPSTEHRIERIKNTPVLRLRDRLLPLVSLTSILEAGATQPEPEVESPAESESPTESESKESEETFIVVAQVGTFSFGIIVDRVFDTEEIVVKPVAPILRNIAIYSGNTILGDGSVIMILDPNGIAGTTGEIAVSDEVNANAQAATEAENARRTSFLLFRAGGNEPKAVPLSLVARLEEIDPETIESTNGSPVVQYRGQIMPLVAFAGVGEPTEGARQHVIVFADGQHSMGLMVDEIVDIVEDSLDVQLTSSQNGILGSAVIGGQATDIIDASAFLGDAFGDWFGTAEKATRTDPEKKDRVLVVDDSAFFRNLLTPLLTVAGYTVVTADSGNAALKMREAGEKFDVIVSDIEMPGMTGHEFAENVRRAGSWQETPMVALSSHISPADLERGHQSGFDDYIGKLDREALLHSLTQKLTGLRGAA